jgi:uncharacterized protein (DUF1330 family)
MTCYAIGHLRDVDMGPEIRAYLEGIDATLAPYGGRFLLHGGAKHHLEGAFPGDLVALAFADQARALAWYRSAAYQRLLPLRLRNARTDVFLMEGVGDDHRATDILAP